MVVACSKVLSPAFALNEQRNITNLSGYFPGVFQKHYHSADLLSKQLMYMSKMREYRAHTRGKQETNSKFCSFFFRSTLIFLVTVLNLYCCRLWTGGVLVFLHMNFWQEHPLSLLRVQQTHSRKFLGESLAFVVRYDWFLLYFITELALYTCI